MVNVNYSNEVFCKHCSERHLITECKFIVNFGYQCPVCGRRTRTKSHTKSVYKPVIKSKHTIPYQIRDGPKDRLEYQRQYSIDHPEVKQRFYEKHPNYNRNYYLAKTKRVE